MGVQADGDVVAGVVLADRELAATQPDQSGRVHQPIHLHGLADGLGVGWRGRGWRAGGTGAEVDQARQLCGGEPGGDGLEQLAVLAEVDDLVVDPQADLAAGVSAAQPQLAAGQA